MSSPLAFIRSVATITASHVKAHKRLWLALAFGLFTPVTVLAALAFYQGALKEMGISVVKNSTDPVDLGLQMVSHNRSIGQADYERIKGFVESTTNAELGTLVKEINRTGQTPNFVMLDQGAPPVLRGDVNHAYLFYQTRMDEHAAVTQGRLPRAIRTPGFPVEAVIGERAAAEAGITLPKVFELYPFVTDPSQKMTVNIVGLVRPRNLSEEYWMGHGEQFSSLTGGDSSLVPMYIPEDTFYGAVAGALPSVPVSYWWYVYTNVENLTSRNYQEASAAMGRLEVNLNQSQPRMLFFTNLSRVLDLYEQKLFFARIPVSVLSFLVAGIAFIYLVFVSSFLLSSLSSELALLRSRGASNLQLLSVFAFQGLVLSLLALVVGIPLAAALVALLGLVSPFSIISGSSLLWVGVPSSAVWLGALGALVGFVAILVPAIRASSVTSVTARSMASRPQAHFFTRYYLDVFLAVAAGALYWQLSSSGSFVSSDLFSGRHEDKLLLAAPMLLILAGVLIFMRIFPIAVSLVVAISKPLAGVVPVLVLRRVSRDVSSYSVMVALIGLATGLGVFVASFGGTLSRSYSDRALYNIGADARLDGVVLRTRPGPSVPYPGPLGTITGVESMSPIYYDEGRVGTSGFDTNMSIVGVDPATFTQTAWFREDFSSESVGSLMGHLVTKQATNGLALPEGTRTVSVSIKPVQIRRDLTLYVRIQDANRHYFSYALGVLDFTDWRQFTANISAPPAPLRPTPGLTERPTPVGPLKLMTIYALQTSSFNVAEAPGGFHFGGIEAGLIGGSKVSLITEMKLPEWQTIALTREPSQDAFDTSETVLLNGNKTGFFSWGAGLPSSLVRGVRYGPQWQSLPAIMDAEFMRNEDIGLGEHLEARAFGGDVTVMPVAKANYFPTTNPTRNPFMIINLWDTLERINITSANSDVQPSSLWLKTDSQSAVKASVQSVRDNPQIFNPSLRLTEDMVESFHIDPLIAAGWRGLVAIAFGAALIIGVTAYLFTNIYSSQRHVLDLAVLQAMGLTRKQWVTSVVLEHAIYLTCGFIAGAIIGTRLASSIMPFLAVTEGGDKVVPPFVIETDWVLASLLMVAVIVTFCVIIALTFRRLRNLPVVETIRAGQQ